MKRNFIRSQRKNPTTEILVGRYIRKYDEILLLPKYIDVTDVFLDEALGVRIKYLNDHGEECIGPLDFLTNFCRNEKEKRHAIYARYQT